MPLMVSMLKTTVFHSMAIWLGGNAQHGDFSPVRHVGDHVAEGGGVAGHFQADVKSLLHAQFLLGVAQVAFAHVQGQGRPHAPGQLQPVFVHVRHHDVAGARVLTTAAAITPIGPAPVINTSSPSTPKESAVCTALPNGSKMAATSGSIPRR